MSEDAKKTRRVRQVVANEQSRPEAPTPRRSRRVRLPKNRHLSEIIDVPSLISGETKPETNRRWRSEEEMLRACMSEGMPRNQIKRVLGMTDKELGIVEKRLLANDGQSLINASTAHRYYTYVLQQEQCARDLEYILSMVIAEMKVFNEMYLGIKDGNCPTTEEGVPILPPKPSPQAAIMAIKAKSEIMERTIRMGQDLGLIEKRAKELRVSGGLNLAAIPTEELRVMLSQKLEDFENLVGKGTLPTVYQRMLQSKKEPHDHARLRGYDGSNLDTQFDPVST